MPWTPPPTGPGRCSLCQARVIWTLTTANRKPLAVNPAHDDTGNQAVWTDSEGEVRSRQLSSDRPNVEIGEVLHRPHVASCTARTAGSSQPRRAPTTVRRSRSGFARPGWYA
jgi:hypothetical protein